MNAVLTVLTITLACSLFVQFLLVLGFVRRLNAWKVDLLPDDSCPEAVAILCLRGSDPYLSRCIQSLMSQDYPRYRICFVLDHPQDPAVAILDGELAKHDFGRFEIQTLQHPSDTCSLKCSCLVQAITGLDNSTQFVALLDADTIPHSSWLREMATALQPSDVGAVTGNRWYMPEVPSQGALIRYVWNAAAVVQMYWYRIAWGGSLAIKMDSIRAANLLERWQHALCEDTMLSQQLSRIGQKVQFTPSLMMINREDCSVGSYLRWVKRQLLTARLYHPMWIAVIAHGLSSAFFLLWGWLLAALLILQQDWYRGLLVTLLMVLFQACLSMMLPWMESSVRRIVRARNEPVLEREKLGVWRAAWTVCATQWLYTWALVCALFMRRVEWRGVEYRVDGAWKIRLLEYRTMTEAMKPNSSNESL